MKIKSIAIVGLGNSSSEYLMSRIRSEKFDETWAINSVSSVIFHDKMFMMDPPSRFLDTPFIYDFHFLCLVLSFDLDSEFDAVSSFLHWEVGYPGF